MGSASAVGCKSDETGQGPTPTPPVKGREIHAILALSDHHRLRKLAVVAGRAFYYR